MRRERWALLAAILQALEEENAPAGGRRITIVASRANIPHDRLAGFLKDLEAAGLITAAPGSFPTVTPRGRDYLAHYAAWIEGLSRFGLE